MIDLANSQPSQPDPQAVLQELMADLEGIANSRPFDEVSDIVHEKLLRAGVREEDALDLNRRLCEAVEPRLPLFHTFEVFLTRFCNLDCPYCFVHSKNQERMSRETADRAVECITKYWNHDHYVSVLFMGGEPTAAFPLMRHIVLEIEKRIPPNPRKYRFDVTTNGTLLTENMMRFFAGHNVKVLHSMDGDKASHDSKRRTLKGQGSFDDIVSRLPMVRRFQPYTGVRMTPTPETIGELSHDFEVMVDLGFRKIIIGPATGVEWPQDKLDELLKQTTEVLALRRAHPRADQISLSLEEVAEKSSCCGQEHRWGCRAGRTGMAIDIDGSIYPCSKVIGSDKPRERQLVLGNVVDGITGSELHQKLNGVTPINREGCWDCDVRGFCHGGCYAVNIENTGDAFPPGKISCAVIRTMASLSVQEISREQGMAREITGLTRAASSDAAELEEQAREAPSELVGRIQSSAHNSSRLDAPAGVTHPRFTYE